MTEQELKQKYGNEKVLVVENDYYESWLRVGESPMKALENAVTKRGYYEYRYKAELDTSLRQVIPYVVLKNDGKYLITKRLKGDSRLVGKHSIGVGGHVDHADYERGRGVNDIVDFRNTVINCIKRELREETTYDGLNGELNIKLSDVFIDDSSDVSRVHICILTEVELYNVCNEIEINEVDKLEGQWVSVEELNDLIDKGTNFENWSEVAIEKLGLRKVKAKEVKPKAKKKGAKKQ
ncbi:MULTISPECIES: NUDIX domain-containing protein [Erysipelotrichaceae]|uniref:NUDIX domain-containing protein n=1 Tax=Erysipelotrichaceae TaxID=128827 RepID=UPI000E48C790|nr:NUDIX domain-containing protein [Absiella sp. AM27-20]RHU03262.1 hypothetical protein DW716_15690 [Absiella sp. AM27-20]